MIPRGRRARRFWLSGAVLLLLLWALLYLPHLRSSPRWYGDELVTLLAGQSLVDGSFANRALRYSYFSGFTNYQPPVCFLYALAARVLAGGDILGARVLAVLFALATALAAFHLLSSRGRIVDGLSAGVLLLAAPESLVHFRWVYPHLAVALSVVVAGLLLDRPPERRRDWSIGLACALAASAHLLVVHVTLAALLARWRHPRSWLRIAAPPAVVLLANLLLGWAISGRQLFLDLGEVALQYTTHTDGSSLLTRAATVWRFFSWDLLHVLYLLALVVLGCLRRFALVAFAGLIGLLVIQNRPELPVFYYQAIIFTPLLAVCLALALRPCWRSLLRSLPAGTRLPAQRLAMLALPVLVLLPSARASLAGTITSRNDFYVAPSIADLESTAAWVNQRSKPQDLVVAFWDLGWMLRARWTDIIQCAVWEYGSAPEFYKRQRSREEFLFPANVRAARFLVVGPLDVRFAFAQGNVARLLQATGIERWPVVSRTATTVVLANPALADAAGGTR